MRLPWTLGLAVPLMVFGCSKENNIDQSTNVSDVGRACGKAADLPCKNGSACVLGYCRAPCVHDSECTDESVCVGDNDFGCSLTWEIGCSSSQRCDAPLRCDPNGAVGVCRNACDKSQDCALANYTCVESVCVPKP